MSPLIEYKQKSGPLVGNKSAKDESKEKKNEKCGKIKINC